MSDAPHHTLNRERGTIELVLGNIVEQKVDAIVNAANTKLTGGGGVDGAIHRAAGPELLRACLEIEANDKGQRCPTAEVRVTPGFQLPARWVIHAVGPFFDERSRAKAHRQLRTTVARALAAARELGAASVALPAISTGAYRFPLDEAAHVSVDASALAIDEGAAPPLVRFVLFDPRALAAFVQALP